MSRKAKIADEVKAGWNSVKFYELTRGYASPKALPTLPEGSVVILHHMSKENHPFFWLAPMLHPLLFPEIDDGTEPPMILLLDISELCSSDEDMTIHLNAEGSSKEFEKVLGKPAARALDKLHLKQATLIAVDLACQLLLKLLLAKDHRLDGTAVSKAVLIHPNIPTTCVNSLFTSTSEYKTKFLPILDCLFESERQMNKRSSVLRSVFTNGTDSVNNIKLSNDVPKDSLFKLSLTQRLFSFIPQLLNTDTNDGTMPLFITEDVVVDEGNEIVKQCFDEEWFDPMGRSLFMSELTIEMSKYTKQYEQYIVDMTYDLKAEFINFVKRHNTATNGNNSTEYLPLEDGDQAPEIGAIVLRGCRCVLVRSLAQPSKWPGVRIPHVKKKVKESQSKITNQEQQGIQQQQQQQQQEEEEEEEEEEEDDFATAIRAVSELCEVDGINELIPLHSIPPIALYLPTSEKPPPGNEEVPTIMPTKKVLVYFLYAKMPPPPGPLEEADIEDEEDLYDWYTFPRAVEALRNGSADVYVQGEEFEGAYDASLGDVVRPCMIDGVWKDRGEASILGLHTAAFSLHAAASANQVPVKWGGVFGQELIHSMFSPQHKNTDSSSLSSATDEIEGPSPSYLPPSSLRPLPVPYSEVSEGNEEEIAYYAKLKEADPLKTLKDLSLTNTNQEPSLNGAEVQSSKPIPVTLLSGFLGAGKTTLMKHILTNKQGLKVAVIVNDMADINVDASILKDHSNTLIHKEEKMIELTNGCICCTLREDLFEAISALSLNQPKDGGGVDYILIESTGIAEPLPVAETFTFEDPNSGLSLNHFAKLDTLVTVIDGSTFIHELTSIDELKARGWETTKEDERTIAQLFVDQLEFANVLILNKVDLLTRKEIDRIKAFLYQFNQEAIVIESQHGQVNPDQILNTNMFSMMQAAEHPDWLKEARIGEHNPESLEYGISSFTFKSHKPFHPERLYRLIKIITSRKTLEELERGEKEEVMVETSLDEGPASCLRVIRAKGVMWLATQLGYNMQGVASYAGNVFSVSPGNAWWASIEKDQWPPKLEEAIQPLWRPPHGDRQNEIVVIGQHMNHALVQAEFQKCVLTDDEFNKPTQYWYDHFTNPFVEEWDKALKLAELQSHDHSHDHHQ